METAQNETEIESAWRLLGEHSNRRKEIEGELATIQAAIDSQPQAPVSKEVDEQLSALQQQRQDLLADIALGKADDSTLPSIDAAITQIEEEKKEAIRKADEFKAAVGSTIAGLQRKRGEVQGMLVAHNRQTVDLALAYLHARAEHLGEAYMQAVSVVSENYKELIALGKVINTVKGGLSGDNFLTRACWNEISLPLFKVTACEHIRHHHLPVVAENSNGLINDYMSALADLGLRR